MSRICWYFELHQPWRLRPYSLFEISQKQRYFAPGLAKSSNPRIIRKVADKSYIPMLSLLVKLLEKYPDFCFSLSFSGVFLEQIKQFSPEVLVLLQKAVATGQVEILSETYFHSLASLYSQDEFTEQIHLHDSLIKKLFAVTPKVFRNTELIYSDAIADQVAELGFEGMLTEGADKILGKRKPTKIYWSGGKKKLPLLLKNYTLSDDLAFRFSQQDWKEWPLTVEKYVQWLTKPFAKNDLVNLFMDFETFGEHQWEAAGIFPFFEELIGTLSQGKIPFVTPSQILKTDKSSGIFSAERPISWADLDRDLSAWIGNPLQVDTLRVMYSLESAIKKSNNKLLLRDWRRLQTSDHFYYMSTKWAGDGDVHAYFSPYESPYEAYRNFALVLADLKQRVEG